MSEPMSSVEIEDVLSSIRRLVSDDLRPGGKKPDAAAAATSDKLILTPALRIATEEGAPVAEAPAEPAISFSSIRQAPAPSPVDAVMTEVGRSADIGGDDWEPAAGEDVAGFAKGASGDWSSDLPNELPSDTHGDLPSETHGDLQSDWPEADALTAPPSTSEGDSDQADWASVDAAEPAYFADTAPEPGANAGPAASDALDEVAVMDQDDGRLPDSPDWMEEPVSVADVDDGFAAERPRAAQPDVMQDPDWVDAAEAEVRAALEDSATESVFVRFDDLDSHDERPFDEEMLRDLVRDIIREELQGALGERITRNVRKLVRAEIARALAVRDFE